MIAIVTFVWPIIQRQNRLNKLKPGQENNNNVKITNSNPHARVLNIVCLPLGVLLVISIFMGYTSDLNAAKFWMLIMALSGVIIFFIQTILDRDIWSLFFTSFYSCFLGFALALILEIT